MTETEDTQSPSDRFGRFPIELAGEFETTSGITVQVRPICPDDDHSLIEFHERLSAQSVYRRFFFLHPHLSVAEVERFTHVDYVGRLALVAESEGRFVAVGRYDRIAETSDAEVAFVVADDFQHQGIGTALLERLADAARTNGITVFVAQTLAENHQMLEVFRRSGFHVTSTTDFGTVSVRFSIDADDAYRRAYAARRREDSRMRDRSPSG
jgi:GNAT superfamily N-acetyltransferase